MRPAAALILLAGGGLWQTAPAQVAGDAAVQAQWFTGSLEAPSPALPKAGLLAIEPYLIYQDSIGEYDNNGVRHSVSDDVNQVESVTMLKFGITDRLSIEALPAFSHVWNDQTSLTNLGDLPLELEYRFNDENNRTGFPSMTAAVGISLPIGHYDHLHAPLDGLGSGAYTLKEGLLFQSLFDTPGHHPVRLRFYAAAFEPLANVQVHDLSVYGTAQGFVGHATPGFAAELGVGGGYALDQSWVLAFDLVQNVAHATRLYGVDRLGNSVNMNDPRSAKTAVAPAIEYNFSDYLGIIAGVEFSVAGRNSASYIAPQIALSASL